jgi:two-component system sensor histidine kinase ChiS
MKRFLLTFVCLAALSGGAFYIVSMPREHSVALSSAGILDLRGADLRDNVYALAGEWEFYWERLLEPADFAAGVGSESEKSLIRVPSSWTEAGYPNFGYATYRVTILAGDAEELMIYVPEISFAASVWINGTLVQRAGRVGRSRDEEITAKMNDILNLPIIGGVAEVVVQVSNFERLFVSGLRFNFLVGRESVLSRVMLSRWAAVAGISGAFAVIALYHFMLWGFRRGRDEIIYMFFAAASLIVGIRFLMESNSLLIYAVPAGARYWMRAYVLFFALYTVFITLFTLIAFEVRLGRVMRAVYAAVIFIAVSAQFLPPPAGYRVIYPLYIVFVITVVLAARTLSFERVRNRPYLVLYLVALVFLASWAPLAHTLFDSWFFLATLPGNVFLMLSQFAMLSREYYDARRRAHELTARTDLYHRLSHDLLTPLTKVSTNIQVANMYPETDHERLTKSQAEIMKMAGMINSALMEGRDGEDEDG